MTSTQTPLQPAFLEHNEVVPAENPSMTGPRPMSRGTRSVPVSLLLLSLALFGCGSNPAQPHSPPPPPPAPAEHIPPPAESPEEENGIKRLSGVGFSTPESVYFDKKRDVYLVSNINGTPFAKNGKGFISQVTPEGEVKLKFIDGETNGVELNAPKGITVSGDTIYIADIDRVALFDAVTGEPKGEHKLAGSTFVNDVTTGVEGIIYISDSGLNSDWQTNGTDAIYTLEDGKITKLLAHKTSLGSPNGLLAGDGGVWVVSGRGDLYWVSDQGKQDKIQQISEGGNDGIIHTDDGRFYISSWNAQAIYSGSPGGEFKLALEGLEAPADIGFDCRRNRLLIPLFKKDEVLLKTLEK